MEKVVTKKKLSDHNEIAANLQFWLSKTPEERIEAVEFLRRQYVESTERLQRVVRIIKLKKS